MLTCAEHEKFETLNVHVPGQTRSNKRSKKMMLCLLVVAVTQRRLEDGDGRGQCDVVQEAPGLGTVGWGLNPNSDTC